jgi:hypothetical protein
MTIKLTIDDVDFLNDEYAPHYPSQDWRYSIFTNIGDLDEEGEYSLKVISLHSMTALIDTPLLLTTTNPRYSEFIFGDPQINLKADLDGVYTFVIYQEGEEIDRGLVKVKNAGNELPSKKYVSDNEDRKAKVLYRPKD